MALFMGIHSLPPGAVTRQQMEQLAMAGQADPVVKGYRSFFSNSDGKLVCVMEAPDKEALAQWFQRMKLPYDAIVELEYEGERGAFKALK